MKKLLLITLFFLKIFLLDAQNIYEYEKEIENKEEYLITELSIEKEEVYFSGTLITPKKDFDKIILIVSGTGLHSRYAHHNLAGYLLSHNHAVFRFDKRGVGKSNGEHNDNLSVYIKDLEIILAGLKNEEQFKNKKIGILGHSLGGLAAIGILEKGVNFDFLIQLGTPVGDMGAFIKNQLIQRHTEKELEKLFKIKNINQLQELIDIISTTIYLNRDNEYLDIYKKVKKNTNAKGFKEKQFRRFVGNEIFRYNFNQTYIDSKIPILYLIGTEDSLVSAKKSMEIINSFNKNNIRAIEFKGLNHFLTTSGKIKLMSNNLYEIDKAVTNEIIKWMELKN